MEKNCEFCMTLKAAVYCKADAAHLCLSCDAKVHSANALSFRHLRGLTCELCRCQHADVRCLDHEMLMCLSCDSGHDGSFRHRKRVVGTYSGCPSAMELAALWGIDLNEIESSSSSKVIKTSFSIVQQIMDLERYQQDSGDSPLRKVNKNLRVNTEQSGGDVVDFEDKFEDSLSSPFSHIDNPFWQCKIPVQIHNNETWMQDLGVCDDVQCFDDVNIPDVDPTFKNFDETFGGKGDATDGNSNNTNKSCFDSWELISSISVSRITGESSGSEYKDDGVSPHNVKRNSDANGGDRVAMRYKEKKVERHEKQAKYAFQGSKVG